MDVYETVKKLVGPINPVGETNTDDERYENLKVMVDLVRNLVDDLDSVAFYNKDRVEFSMKRAGQEAHKCLKEISREE